MANNKPSDPTDEFVLLGLRLSPRVFNKPHQVADLLKYFGSQRRSTLRKIVLELDTIATDYRIAQKKKALKFEEADPILERFENSLLKTKQQWLDELRPLHPAIIALRIKMIPRSERKQKVDAAMVTIDLDGVATTLLRIIKKLRSSKTYAGFHHRPGGKSLERAFLWEPVLRLFKKYGVKPGQHGSFSGAIRCFHFAIGIDPPSGALKKMIYELKQGGSRARKVPRGYSTVKKGPNA